MSFHVICINAGWSAWRRRRKAAKERAWASATRRSPSRTAGRRHLLRSSLKMLVAQNEVYQVTC